MSEVDSFINKFSGLTEEYKFYDGQVTLRYDPKDHVYLLVTPEGLVKQDGCTTICHIIDKSNVLLPWGCKMMAQKLMASIPTEVSDAVEVVGTWDGSSVAPIKRTDLEKLVQAAKSAHRDKLEDAGEVGHKAHAWVEDQIKSLIAHKDDDVCYGVDVPRDDPRVTNCCMATLHWMTAHNVRWRMTERKIYSRQYSYAGTMDGLALVDSCNDPKCCRQAFKDHLAVIDWKTSNYLYNEYILQTAAYKQAYQEETGEVIDDIFIVKLGKEDGEFEAWHIESELAAAGWDAFLKALWLSRSMKELEELVGTLKDHRKAIEKAAKAAQKAEDLKVKCKGADKYKGVRKPTCNGGNPCQTCIAKYENRLKELQAVGISKDVFEAGNEISQRMLESLQKLLDNPENV